MPTVKYHSGKSLCDMRPIGTDKVDADDISPRIKLVKGEISRLSV